MDSPNRQTDAARLYHELTKHSYTSVRTDGHVLDWDNRPFPFKIYPHAAALALPRELNLSPDGKTLYWTNYGSHSLQAIAVGQLPH